MIYKIANQFKKPSGLLGRLVSSLMARGNKHAYKALVNDMKIEPTHTLLEIGYGPGAGIKDIFAKADPAKLYGIDFSPLMFERASRANSELIKRNKVQLLFGDFADAHLPVANFDRIFCINVVYFWEDLQKPFEKIKNLLNDNGAFHFYMSSKADLDRLKFTDDDVFNKHSIEKVEEVLKQVGFTQVNHYYKNGYFVEARKR